MLCRSLESGRATNRGLGFRRLNKRRCTGVINEVYFGVVLTHDVAGDHLCLLVCHLHEAQDLPNVSQKAAYLYQVLLAP